MFPFLFIPPNNVLIFFVAVVLFCFYFNKILNFGKFVVFCFSILYEALMFLFLIFTFSEFTFPLTSPQLINRFSMQRSSKLREHFWVQYERVILQIFSLILSVRYAFYMNFSIIYLISQTDPLSIEQNINTESNLSLI